MGKFVVAALAFTEVAALRTSKLRSSKVDLETYSFDQFVEDFDRSYHGDEFRLRQHIFHQSLSTIQMKNTVLARKWTAGVHQFMDWTAEERSALNGYKPTRSRRGIAALQTATTMNGTLADSVTNEGPPIRNQGNCGSCWAISAVEAVEAQLMRQGTQPPRLSAQALVNCVPNPQHCGGTGGCDGATGELAYSFMKDYGIPLEDDLTYDAHTDACPVGLSGPWPTPQRARLSGWTHLESNKAHALMDSLNTNGPTVVAVDANDWFDYESGIFDGCAKDATLGHAVLATGYGEENGQKYWLIQNSWGADWGENGHIRLARHHDEDSHCGTDSKPQEGEGCDGGPSEVTVCGSCGILYDPLVPNGATIESASGVSPPTTTAEVSMFKPGPDPFIKAEISTTTQDAGNAVNQLSADEQKEFQSIVR